MAHASRLEPAEVRLDGPSVRIVHLGEDPDVILEFKTEESARAAHSAICNYLDVVDVDCTDEAVMHMLELILGRHESAD